MGIQSRDPKGDRRTTRGNPPTHASANPQVTREAEPPRSLLDDGYGDVGRKMFAFSERDNGYFKCRRSADSSDLHLTWTWSLGTHAGSYVYARVEWWKLIEGLTILERKLMEVEAGSLRPSPDKLITRFRP